MEIIKEVGKGIYTKYLRCLFNMHRMENNPKFCDTIREERMKWMFSQLKADYYYTDPIDLILKVLNNQLPLAQERSHESKEGEYQVPCIVVKP
eukprot:14747071-Ditylum_brightwellii.AAC.2